MPRKRVAQQVLSAVPEPKEHEKIVQLERPVGKHLYEVRFANGELGLCRMPPRFRNMVYIKRGARRATGRLLALTLPEYKGHHLIIETNSTSTKVEGDIVHILYDAHKRQLKDKGLWPPEFELAEGPTSDDESMFPARDSDDSDNDDDLVRNPNRPPAFSSDEEEEAEDEDEEGENGDDAD